MNLHKAPLLISIVVALGACSQDSRNATPSADRGASPANLGARLYDANCAACHQQDGSGIPGVYPTMIGSPVVMGDATELAQWVLKGRRPAAMPVGRYPTRMASFDWMKPAAAAALLTYLRSSFGNSAPPVDAATVAKAVESPP
jgi:mono/diheme cytochrome c family protein